MCHGKPCICGHRIWVPQVLDLLADIRARLACGAEIARARMVTMGRKGAA